MSPTSSDDSSSSSPPSTHDDKSFLCHAATRRKSELSFAGRSLDASVMKPASACPVNVDTYMALGTLGYSCVSSSQAWTPPPHMHNTGHTHEERMTQAAGGASCAKK